MRTTMRTTRLTPLGRLVAMILLLSVGAVAGAAGAAATRPHAQEWRCVMVSPGDTLWRLTSAGGDPRPVIDRVIGHNGLDGGFISPGMAIWVPRDHAPADLPEAEPELCASRDEP